METIILSEAEYKVFRQLMKSGGTNKQIGQALYLTEHTIKSHMKNIFKKTGATSRHDLLTKIYRDEIKVGGWIVE